LFGVAGQSGVGIVFLLARYRLMEIRNRSTSMGSTRHDCSMTESWDASWSRRTCLN
jgi:hypothetical protein